MSTSSLVPAAPVGARIDAIDVVRGLALFGVLAINLDTEFRVSLFEQFLPPPTVSEPLDGVVRAVLKTVFEFKAFALFAFLFGVGLAIQFERLEGRADRTSLLVRRLAILFAFGLIHLLLIWNGDILTEYAVAGFMMLPLLAAPRAVLALVAALALGLYVAMPWLPLPFEWFSSEWIAAHVSTTRDVYKNGSFGEILAFRVSEVHSIGRLHVYVFPRTIAMMLLGALAWRCGLLSRAAQHAGLLRNTAIVAIGSGAAVYLLPAGVTGAIAGALAPVALAIGYAAAIIWVLTATRFRPLLTWAAPVGQMAFTNYITQSIVLGLLFYGYGLGLMGELGPAAGLGVAMVIYVVQIFVSSSSFVCPSRSWQALRSPVFR